MKIAASLSAVAVIAVLSVLSAPPAAAVAASCTPGGVYTCANGSETFPGTYVGTIGNGPTEYNQIGNAGISGNASVSTATNPSIYSFFWSGGAVLIQEKIGNNGIGDAIDVELDALASKTSTATPVIINSIQIPFSSGPSPQYVVFSGFLNAGYYAIDSYLSINNVTDPYYQINFAVPEPTTLALMGAGLLGLGLSRRRRI